jgi:hypothetical protein
MTQVSGMDVSTDPISPGSGREREEQRARDICSRDVFLLFWSRAAARSRWVEREWRRALECRGASGKPEIQVHVLEGGVADLLPEELRQFAATPVEEKPEVFISGTWRDLPEYHEVVRDACLSLGMLPRRLADMSAQPADVVRGTLDLMDTADVYIGIVAHRYGYLPEGSDISIVQMEYERAVERGIPRLIFMLDNDVPVSPSEIDVGENALKLNKLKDRLKSEQAVAFFKDAEDLRARVLRGLILVRQQLDAGAADESARSKSARPVRKRRGKGEDLA